MGQKLPKTCGRHICKPPRGSEKILKVTENERGEGEHGRGPLVDVLIRGTDFENGKRMERDAFKQKSRPLSTGEREKQEEGKSL